MEEAERQRRIARVDEVTKSLFEAIQATNVKVKLEKYRQDVVFAKDSTVHIRLAVPVTVRVKAEDRNYRWNGKVRITVEYWRTIKQFPERKKGFDYAEIAKYIQSMVKAYYDDEARRADDEVQRELTDDIENRIRKRFASLIGAERYVCAFDTKVRLEHRARPDSFKIEIVSLDEDTAKVVLSVLDQIDSLKSL